MLYTPEEISEHKIYKSISFRDVMIKLYNNLPQACLPLLTVVFLLIGCGEGSKESGHGRPSYGFESDSFALSATHEGQMSLFEALFLSGEGSDYTLPGNPEPSNLKAFFKDVRESYYKKSDGIDYSLIGKQYHTFTHALDVMISTHALLQSGGGAFLKRGEQAALVLAALGHDSMHTGVTNKFLINSKHPYSLATGHESLQEKRSVEHVFGLLDKHQILVIEDSMSKSLQAEIRGARTLIKQSILWTDISQHKNQMAQMTNLAPELLDILSNARGDESNENKSGAVESDLSLRVPVHSLLQDDSRLLIAAFILHAADISNPGRDWETCERWAGLVMNEFFSQGDLEKKLGLPISMNCDRDKVLVPFAQIGFGKFVIRDLYMLLAKILPTGGGYLLSNFEENQKKWKAIEEEVLSSGVPYAIKFKPPTRAGGWFGESAESN